MRKDLERRLRRLELASSRAIEVWCEQPDRTLRGPDGQRMTRKAFFRLHPPGSPGVFVANAVDARL
jgi:hypothetical protein